MFLFLRLVAVLFIFWFLQPSFESIYYYHFGTVTNSDALYPYLFIRDLTNSFSLALGWVTPPSHCFFPDLMVMYLIQIFVSDIFWIHWFYSFFCFISIIYLMRSFGFNRIISLITALTFLKLGEMFPREWGQFFLPSFHASEFLMLGLSLRIIKKDSFNELTKAILLGLLIGISIYSELWFFVHTLPILSLFIITSLKPKLSIFTLLVGFITLKGFQFLQKQTGIGSFQIKQFPLKETIENAKVLFSYEPITLIGNLFSHLPQLPLSEYMIPTFWVFCLILFYKMFKQKFELRIWILPFAFVFTSFFIKFSQIEPNARYFYFLPISIIVMFFFILKNNRIFTKIISYILLIGLLFYSHRYWVEPKIQNKINIAKLKMDDRLLCVSRTVKLWNVKEGSSTYWPVKYLRTFSMESIHLLPFTKEGIYYPWVHNLNWDKELDSKVPNSFAWGIVSKDENLLFGQKEVMSQICVDWKLVRISN